MILRAGARRLRDVHPSVESSAHTSSLAASVQRRAVRPGALQGNPAGHRESQELSQELWRFAAKIWGRFAKASQRSPSQTAHLGCKMIAAGPMGRRSALIRSGDAPDLK